jgi:hypothetical protein
MFFRVGVFSQAISEECIGHLERFVVLMYDKTSEKTKVDDARKQLFSQKGRSLDSIPPTRVSAYTTHQASCVSREYCVLLESSANYERPTPESTDKTGCGHGQQMDGSHIGHS